MRTVFALLAVLFGLWSAALLSAADVTQEWRLWSPREEIAPRGAVDTLRYRSAPDSLRLSGASNAAVFGGWRRRFDNIQPGKWYRLTAWRRTEGLQDERLRVVARLSWEKASGKGAGRPEYARSDAAEGDWTRLSAAAPAPEEAGSAVAELFLLNAPQATVWWDDVTLEEIAAPAARPVRVVAVNLRPRNTGSAAASVERFAKFVEDNVADADVILLPEGVTLVGTGKKYVDVAQTVPGPATDRLGRLAKAKNAYVVAGVIERDGHVLYNTAVLIDRQGRVAGKYHKVYLPREEIEGGLTPGVDYPVFETDFGKVGVMICWDVQYADPARALALRGAEMLLMPIWGGNETLAAARAIENQVFLVTSGYDHPTYVMDPMGEILSKAPADGSVASAVVDLNKRYTWPWLGEMRGRFFHELRTDVPVE